MRRWSLRAACRMAWVLVVLLGLLAVGVESPSVFGAMLDSLPAGRFLVRQGTQKTIWDRIYTEEQAKRGQEIYVRACGVCHGDDLRGADGPALVGSVFSVRWRDEPVARIFGTRSTMPQDNPGGLGAQAYVDIISFVLKANGSPAGDVELPPDPERLERIFITEKPAR